MPQAGIEPAPRGFLVPTQPLSYRGILQGNCRVDTRLVLLYETLLGGLTCCTCLFRVEGDRIWTCPEDLTLLFHRAALHITRRILTLISVGNLSIPRLFRISLSLFAPLTNLTPLSTRHTLLCISSKSKNRNIAVYVLRGILDTKLTVFQILLWAMSFCKFSLS